MLWGSLTRRQHIISCYSKTVEESKFKRMTLRTKLAGMKSACTFPTSPKCLRRATSTCLCSFTTQHHSERPSWRNSMTKFITNFRRPKQGQVCIRTKDKQALKAVHEFLRFQIAEHQTGDRTDI